MKKKLILLAGILFLSVMAFSQEYTISGRITNANNGEDLFSANIIDTASYTGAISNSYGFYSLTLPKGKYIIKYTYIGYQTIYKSIDLNNNITENIKLEPTDKLLSSVTVTGEREDHNVSSTDIGVEKLEIKDLETIPVIFGEKDILKTIQLLPGISSTSEGSTGFSVRGGSFDQNLILLDEAIVYSPSHLMGFFSVFNSDALKNMEIYKGGIPANYGGRASSVIDVQMNNGNNQRFSFCGGLGLISSRLTIEAPIVKDKGSFILSGRRSYLDIVAKPFLQDGFEDLQFYFYDLNAKANYTINENNRVFVSGYFGKDVFAFDQMGTEWGNATSTIRWNHLFSKKLFSNTTLIYSQYDYGFMIGEDAEMNSGIQDYSLKQDFSYFLNKNNTLKFGFASKYHVFSPGELVTTGDFSSFSYIMTGQKALESAIYITNKHTISKKLKVEYGLRGSLFNQLGNDNWIYSYDENNHKSDSTYYKNNSCAQTYWDLEPRISANYRLGKNNSIKASFNRMAQYLHLLSNSTSGQPMDVWIPSSNNVAPLKVNQFSIGYFHNFLGNSIETSVEVYYKDMNNITDYEDGTNILFNENVEAQILNGDGRSYGLELYVKKRFGSFTGWISYTLSKTEKSIVGINEANWYPAKYDKTHDFSIVGSYKFKKLITLSATWIYSTGNAVTFPSGSYIIDGNTIPYYTERNGYRMPAYHRLDFNIHIEKDNDKRFQSSFDISFYNVYNRKNAYTIYFRESETNPGQNEAVKLSLFGIVPSLTWNFKF